MGKEHKSHANEVRIGLTALAFTINPIFGAIVGVVSLVDYISDGKIATAGKGLLDKVKNTTSTLLEKVGWSESKTSEQGIVEEANEKFMENKSKEVNSIQEANENQKGVVGPHTARELAKRESVMGNNISN